MSARPKILLLDEPHPKAKEIIESVADCYDNSAVEIYCPCISDEEDFVHLNKNCDTCNSFDLVYTQLTPTKTHLPVFCPCTGVDHIEAPKIIHLDDAWKQKEGQEITSTAEHTIGLLHQLAKMNRMQLSGKKIWIAGYGRIGKQVAERVRASKMDDYTWVPAIGYEWLFPIPYDSIPEMDVISIHLPLNKNTKGMFDRQIFERMKPGALLINTARQPILNTDDLIPYLKDKKIHYADDFKNEIDLTEYGAIQTEHIAGNTKEAREATDVYIAKKIVEHLTPKFTFEWDGV